MKNVTTCIIPIDENGEPIISINQQLSDIGWKIYGEGETGFRFGKPEGHEYVMVADFKRNLGLRFNYPDIVHCPAAYVNERELELFRAKIKEWRRQYERNTESEDTDDN